MLIFKQKAFPIPKHVHVVMMLAYQGLDVISVIQLRLFAYSQSGRTLSFQTKSFNSTTVQTQLATPRILAFSAFSFFIIVFILHHFLLFMWTLAADSMLHTCIPHSPNEGLPSNQVTPKMVVKELLPIEGNGVRKAVVSFEAGGDGSQSGYVDLRAPYQMLCVPPQQAPCRYVVLHCARV